MTIDYERWYSCCYLLLKLGFDLDKNNARDLLAAINEIYQNYDEYVDSE